jgi:peptidoglycan/LPS O-acetylase OafA/YrhL
MEQQPEEAFRFLESGDEAGTAPGDRKFRPDVEGLRAIAISVVLLLHFRVGHFLGGFIGVDVFFVISGFVITGLLLRERDSTGKTSLMGFYARRSRRIVPLVALVLVITVVCERIFIGVSAAKSIAGQAPSISLFVYNFNHASVLDYIYVPGGPVEAFWSLSVEEQFYLVYPALLITAGLLLRRWDWQRKVNCLLICVVVSSFICSVMASSGPAVWPYLSPFTRAWELGVGGLIAVNAVRFRSIPDWIASFMTWVGLGLILVLSCTIRDDMAYPGWFASLPVAGAALVIIGGTRVPSWGSERFLGLRPVQWLGRWSYGMYLWEIPILVVMLHWHSSLGFNSVSQFPLVIWLGTILVCILLAAVSYSVYEMPIRHSARLRSSPALCLASAVVFIVVSLITISLVSR